MIKVWYAGNTEAGKERLFNKINAGLKDILNKDSKESLHNKGAKDIATTMMSKKVGKNLYVSPSGRKYRRVSLNGQKASKGKLQY